MIPIRELENYYQYYVHEDKGIVIAKISYESLLKELCKECKTVAHKMPFPIDLGKIVAEWIIENVSIKGYASRARCAEGDTWDEEFGKRLAARRLTTKISFLHLRMYDALAEKLYQNKVYFENMADKYDTRVDNTLKSTERLENGLNSESK